MAIDYSALLGLSQLIQVAKGQYDFTRDGGTVGVLAIESSIIPADSIIIGWVFRIKTALTFAPTGAIAVMVGNLAIAAPPPTINYVRGVWTYDFAWPPTDVDRALSVQIYNAACTAGVFDVWVFYLPA